MKRYLITLIVLLGSFTPLLAADINIQKVIINYNQKIKHLQQENKILSNRIEVLSQQQKDSNKKIAELFRLLNYKKSDETTKKIALRVQENNQKIKKSYTNARNFLVSGQYNQAIELFANHLKLYPNSNTTPDAGYWLAQAYAAKEDYQNAKKILIKFQKDNPLHHKFPNSLYELGAVYTALNEKNKAQTLLQSMIKRFPTHNMIIKAKQLLNQVKTPVVVEKK